MKIIISATTSWNLYNSRLGLALALKQKGHEVVLLSPKDEFTEYLQEAGFRWVHLPVKPRGKNIFRELYSILFITIFYLREKPDFVNHFTPKGIIYGSIAAKLAKVKSIFNTVTGLGVVFSEQAHSTLKQIVILLYKIALTHTTILFQNKDDHRLFLNLKIGSPNQHHLISGSGVDMVRFQATPEPEGIPTIILPARFVEEKGIRYFVEASRILKSRQIEARFVLVGRPEEDQPTSIPLSEITNWVNEGIIEWWGWHNDMAKIYPLAHIVCLPTYYMEGIPKSLLEAGACAKALIATDVPGCREVVLNSKNGLLVKTKNAQSLANAIATLVQDNELRKKMGIKSREIVEEKFSMEKIIANYFSIYEI